MNEQFFARAFSVVAFLFGLGMSPANAANWINTSGGSWFDPANWSPFGVPGSSDVVTITASGTYTVLVETGSVSVASITLGGSSGTQTLNYGSVSGPLSLANGSVLANGLLVVTNGGLQGSLLVQSGGQLQLNASSSLFLYNFALTNQGTVTWSSGNLQVGGNSGQTTVIDNAGLWQIAGDNNLSYGGGFIPILLNSGTFRKTSGTGTSTVEMDLINLSAGLVDVSSGTLWFEADGTNVLGGSFTAEAPGQMKFTGNQTDAGGAGSGSGAIQFTSGTFYLQTNTIPQFKLSGGDIYIAGTNTFQLAGAITNLTLDGAQLRGTNRVAGTLTVNSGNLLESLTVAPGGQLLLAAPSGSLLYSFVLLNQGTVVWSGGLLEVGTTTISNGGTWTMTSDANLSYGGGTEPIFINNGLLQKTGGTGTSSLRDISSFSNQASGIVSVGSGTLLMSDNYTNTAGTLQLKGGTLTTLGTLGMTGGQLTGSGTIGVVSTFDGGTISPGPTSGLLQFKSGLSLGSNAAVTVGGTGIIPGTQYAQISVNGPLALNGCSLQVTSLPTVPVGTSFVIITNTSSGALSGAFNGLADNSTLTIGGNLFRIQYAGGTGNAVVLTSASLTGTLLFSGGYNNGGFLLRGTGTASAIYTIQATTDFLRWSNITTVTADPGGAFNFSDPNAAQFPYRFYRTTN